jgi:hypothetical protein
MNKKDKKKHESTWLTHKTRDPDHDNLIKSKSRKQL